MAAEEFTMESLFRSLDTDRTNVVWKWKLLEELKESGLANDDPRVERAVSEALSAGRPFEPGQPEWLEWEQFASVAQEPVIAKALQGRLVLPHSEFAELSQGITQIYGDLLDNRDGQVAQYIPTLRDADPDKFGIAICTADGQVFQIGDTDVGFSIQSTSKAFSYAMALTQHGPEGVHQWVGQEQSGGTFNDYKLSLGAGRKPHNPMINAGAIATLALVDPLSEVNQRFEGVKKTFAQMMGKPPGFDNQTFLAERDTGHGNRALASLMAAEDMLMVDPKDPDGPRKAADFYFQICSLEVDAQRLAAAGATLANGGVAPYSGERVFSADTVGRVLSVMQHSGMYNDSGQFADQVGLPSKSGVSGNVMMVVPEKRLAVVVFSPRLDEAGNSVRGVEVCRRLVHDFDLHPYRRQGAERGREAGATWSGPQAAPAPFERRSDPAYLAFGGVPAPKPRAAQSAGSPSTATPAASEPKGTGRHRKVNEIG